MAYNDISQSNLIADDCGLLYTIGAGLNMKIHHNWFHDTKGRGTLKKAAGIYLDNSAADVSVHHNAIWNITTWPAIQINWSGTNIDINHNTMWNVQAEIVITSYSIHYTKLYDIHWVRSNYQTYAYGGPGGTDGNVVTNLGPQFWGDFDYSIARNNFV